MNTATHPIKLTHDAIMEAVLEIRFDSKDLPEVTVGRLVDYEKWKGFSQARTPISEIPAVIRLADANLRYKPTVELKEDGGPRQVKIGANVISVHNLRPYIGWSEFSKHIESAVTLIFDKLSGINIRRIGLRYINAFEKERHLISNISVLNVSLLIKEQKIEEHYNINYSVRPGDDFVCMTRLATRDFVQGPLPDDAVAYADIDVYTPPRFKSSDVKHILEWLEKAHVLKNDAFFKLIPEHIIEQLREK